MPWREASAMSLRLEFVTLASHEDANIRELCRQYGISPNTAYKWLARYQADGPAGLEERSRRPETSPGQTTPGVEGLVLAARHTHPAWGGRKLKVWLEREHHRVMPAASTITAILRRHGLIDAQEAAKHRAFERFERATPNELWQMDFKGQFRLADGRWCYPLTVLDDHSRYLLGLQACPDQLGSTVQEHLTRIFQCYGLPVAMLMDNGAPWASTESEHRLTALTAWLIRLDIAVLHGRPRHPQTQGKDERLHRTLKAEVLVRQPLTDLAHCQGYFDAWRNLYNGQRPHEALAMTVPSQHYQPSGRPFPPQLPPILYYPADIVRKVQAGGRITFAGRTFRVGKAFIGYPVALRPTQPDGCYEVYFCRQPIGHLDLAHVRRPDPAACGQVDSPDGTAHLPTGPTATTTTLRHP